jgi:hypothetical protein
MPGCQCLQHSSQRAIGAGTQQLGEDGAPRPQVPIFKQRRLGEATREAVATGSPQAVVDAVVRHAMLSTRGERELFEIVDIESEARSFAQDLRQRRRPAGVARSAPFSCLCRFRMAVRPFSLANKMRVVSSSLHQAVCIILHILARRAEPQSTQIPSRPRACATRCMLMQRCAAVNLSSRSAASQRGSDGASPLKRCLAPQSCRCPAEQMCRL